MLILYWTIIIFLLIGLVTTFEFTLYFWFETLCIIWITFLIRGIVYILSTLGLLSECVVDIDFSYNCRVSINKETCIFEYYQYKMGQHILMQVLDHLCNTFTWNWSVHELAVESEIKKLIWIWKIITLEVI